MDTKFKSDKQAKEAVVQHLVEKGFKDVKIVKSPSDIIAMKDGVQWYFEVKMTSHRDRYFGAATFTEWEQAFKTPDTYRFVIAIKDAEQIGGFELIEMTPEEMMRYSTIPPCKVFFNLDISEVKGATIRERKKRESKAIRFSLSAFAIVSEAFNKLRGSLANG